MMRPEDWSGLAPERDRPQGPEFDWQPEALNLTAAAAGVVRLNALYIRTGHYDDDIHSQYLATIALWCALTGMDEPEALTWAYQIADAVPPITGLVPPF